MMRNRNRNRITRPVAAGTGLDLTGAMAAYDFITRSGDVLTDLTGNGRNPTRMGNSTWTAEGLQQVQADGHDNCSSFAASLAVAGDFTIYLGYKTLISGSERFLIGWGGGPYVGTPGQGLRVWDGSTLIDRSAVFPTNLGAVGCIRRASTTGTIFKNGVQQGATFTIATTTWTATFFGALSGSYGTADGVLAYYLFISGADSDAKVLERSLAIQAIMQGRGIPFT